MQSEHEFFPFSMNTTLDVCIFPLTSSHAGRFQYTGRLSARITDGMSSNVACQSSITNWQLPYTHSSVRECAERFAQSSQRRVDVRSMDGSALWEVEPANAYSNLRFAWVRGSLGYILVSRWLHTFVNQRWKTLFQPVSQHFLLYAI